MRHRAGHKVQNIARQVAVRAKDRVRIVKVESSARAYVVARHPPPVELPPQPASYQRPCVFTRSTFTAHSRAAGNWCNLSCIRASSKSICSRCGEEGDSAKERR